MILYDAHNHLQVAVLAPHVGEFLASRAVAGMVVNGTHEGDWAAVAELAAAHPEIHPSYGVHPWHADGVSPDWRERLQERLDVGGRVGEIGLDRGRMAGDFDRQREIFAWQLAEAARREVPATIHCVSAWGVMGEILGAGAVPARGFLLHAYGGPVEMVRNFADRGAYFSFSGSFLGENRERQRTVFREVPLDRLLVETDAPNMPPPPELDEHPLVSDAGVELNHPSNLGVAYEGLARVRGMSLVELAAIVAANYARLFSA